MPSSTKQNLWTDYPIIELGDMPRQEAPIRRVTPIKYDGNKYCKILVGGITTEIKAGYIYTEPGRCGSAPPVERCKLPR